MARTTQESIPIDKITPDGIFKRGKIYSKTYEFTDVNYTVASPDEQKSMFESYLKLLNGLPPDSVTKITIMNTPQRDDDISRDIFLDAQNDGLDKYRNEYNGMLTDKLKYGNGMTQRRFVTLSTERRNEQEAGAFFARVSGELSGSFNILGSALAEVSLTERLRVIGDFYNGGTIDEVKDVLTIAKRGYDFRDVIAPDKIQFKPDHIEINDKFCRVLFLRNYPTYLSDDLVTELTTSVNVPMSLSFDVLPVPTDEAFTAVQNKLLAVDSDRTRFQQRQNRANNFSAIMPFKLQNNYENIRELLEDLQVNDQRLLFGVLTLAHMADTKEQLDADAENFINIAGKYLCKFTTLKYQQEDALNTVLPYGIRPIETVRSFTSGAAAALIPFNAQEIMMPGGVFYGVHAVTKNPLVCNRLSGLNGNGFILGTSGSGKSFITKEELIFICLSRPNDTIMIIDPQGEYTPLVKALGGEVVTIASGGASHINALDMIDTVPDLDYNPIAVKSEFIMSFCEQVMNGSLGAVEKSIIDRCIILVYQNSELTRSVPTLREFRTMLKNQPETEAKTLAVAIEMYTNGNLDMFARETNVNMSNRLISFSMQGMKNQIKPVAMLVVLDAINNRALLNKSRGVNTWTYIDEFHLYFKHKYSGEFLLSCWKTFRKLGAPLTGITQNITECLVSQDAQLMLANSRFLLLLDQSSTDRAALSQLLEIPMTQMSYVTDAAAGCGLLKYGSSLVPFRNEFPKNTELYRLMSTKPQEILL
jgi:hypothetical protein